jgi:aryl-alcohol dehydrogenase-like predicted oxidoreductase
VLPTARIKLFAYLPLLSLTKCSKGIFVKEISKPRRIGLNGSFVFPIGLGCMGMSEFYGATNDAESLATLEAAFDQGVTFYDTADMYGSGHNELLLAKFIHGKRGAITIATKFAIVRKPGEYTRTIDNSPVYIRAACEASLKRLGVDVIDLYYAHRINHDTPLEESIGALGDLVKAGKIRAIGLCEVSAKTLRRAHAIHPISAVQSEYSLWAREPEAEVLPVCLELGVTFVPYSPLGRGFLTGSLAVSNDPNDFRQHLPRLQGDNLIKNQLIVNQVTALASEKKCTPAQLALAWLLAQGDDIVPIPGTRRIKYLTENNQAINVQLSAADLRYINEVIPVNAAVGQRYPEAGMKGLNS